mmetsp:Transcript_39559/g.93144  ORF Transcript_39559/g.93144 Transcript_39559/m.93144 type:complete len:312 (-) Transcript_39559:24-959(-)
MQPLSQQSKGVLATGVAAVAGGIFLQYRSVLMPPPPGPKVLTVMSWNVLARQYTKYNGQHHRATSRLEEKSQTHMRYTLAGEAILANNNEVVLLQECEEAFFESEWNAAAERLLQKYDIYACREGSGPGVAILIKKGGLAKPLAAEAHRLGGTDSTGGPSKLAAVLPIRFGDKDIQVVTVHFTWDGASKKRIDHANLIGSSLGDSSIIMAGDFNCEPGKSLQELEEKTFLGKLQRAKLQNDAPTGLTGDFSGEVAIDHVYTTSDLNVTWAIAQGAPQSPWGGSKSRPAKVSRASDHVPILVKVLESNAKAE